jgi:endonuclease/exonuclease/phosphatase (EEP) superfamily protein YafD
VRRVVGAVAALLATLPDVVLACPVCFDGAGESRGAFLATTAFLTLLPLGMVASAGVWLAKRARRHANAARPVGPTEAPGSAGEPARTSRDS